MSLKALIIWWWGVGSLVWAWLEQDKWFDVDILTKSGFQETKAIDYNNIRYRPKFTYITDQSQNLYDLIVVATKAVNSQLAHQQAENLIDQDWHIITIQSGLHDYNVIHPSHSKAVAYVNVNKTDGIVTVASPSLKLFIEQSNHTIIQSFQWLNHMFTHVDFIDNIDRYIREKLVHISAFSGIVCETGKTIWAIREDTELYNLYLALLDECSAVASSQWYDFDRALFETRVLNTPADVYTSLYYDLLHHKQNEYSALLWKLHTIAHNCNIPIPTIDEVDASIKKQYF